MMRTENWLQQILDGCVDRDWLHGREFNWLDVREDVYTIFQQPNCETSSRTCNVKWILQKHSTWHLGCGRCFSSGASAHSEGCENRKFGTGDFDVPPWPKGCSKTMVSTFHQCAAEEVQCNDLCGTTFLMRIQRRCAMVLHVDDVLFLGEQQWLSDVFLPGLKEEFKLSSTLVDRSAGGTSEFLKRFHVVEPHYTQITVYPEEKHVHTMFEKYSKANGKPPKLCKTPCNTSSTTTSLDAAMQKTLSETLSAEFRSLVGIAMYVSQERFDLQFATKSLATYLKSPTKRAWVDPGRLVGYMKFSESFALRMRKTSKGSSFQGAMFGSESETETQNNLIETYSDSDWSNRSTSAAVHVLNGIVIWSTSRTQKCISSSSTEAKWLVCGNFSSLRFSLLPSHSLLRD